MVYLGRPFSNLFRRDFAKRSTVIKRQQMYSPRDWGRCVFPIFSINDEEIAGCGTGFFVKGVDFGITAEHLLDIEKIQIPHSYDESRNLDLSSFSYGLTTILPSQAILFGTRFIPPEYVQPVKRYIFDIVKKDDPLLFGRSQRFTRRSDLLILEFFEHAKIPPEHWRPRISARIPQVGDWVCAVGFPDIQLQSMQKNRPSAFIQNEGMAVSFARVTEVLKEGRGQYENTPSVFVDSDWPGGMSGGPVFNDRGRIIGIVSRELPSENENQAGSGSFTLLHDALNGLLG